MDNNDDDAEGGMGAEKQHAESSRPRPHEAVKHAIARLKAYRKHAAQTVGRYTHMFFGLTYDEGFTNGARVACLVAIALFMLVVVYSAVTPFHTVASLLGYFAGPLLVGIAAKLLLHGAGPWGSNPLGALVAGLMAAEGTILSLVAFGGTLVQMGNCSDGSLNQTVYVSGIWGGVATGTANDIPGPCASDSGAISKGVLAGLCILDAIMASLGFFIMISSVPVIDRKLKEAAAERNLLEQVAGWAARFEHTDATSSSHTNGRDAQQAHQDHATGSADEFDATDVESVADPGAKRPAFKADKRAPSRSAAPRRRGHAPPPPDRSGKDVHIVEFNNN